MKEDWVVYSTPENLFNELKEGRIIFHTLFLEFDMIEDFLEDYMENLGCK